jgi:adenine-specific DNA-methyltransferase
MNKQTLIQKLKKIEGLNAEERSDLINLLNTDKKYGLVWEDKPEKVEEKLLHSLPVLEEVKENAILASDDAPNHILIEGDNLHALVALSYTHEGKIDVIYIDPPYNTGENDFKYNDKYVDKEDGFRHSKWLAFMNKRLKIMKSLLSDKGVAILHIDENEFDALSLLLETEIFTENDCLGYIVWNKKNPKGDAKEVASMHEYVICFAKNKAEFLSQENTLKRKKPNALEILRKAKTLFNKLGQKAIPDEIKEVVKPFNYSMDILKDFEINYDLTLINKEFQAWIERQSEFSEGEKAYEFIDTNGDVFQTVSMAWPNKNIAPDDYFIPLLHPINKKPCPVPERGWRNPSSTMKSLLGQDDPILLPGGMVIKGEVTFTVNKNGDNNQPRRKYLLKDNMFENTPSIFNYGASDDAFFTSIGLEFPYAKPVNVAKYLISSVHPNPKIILDFFAGSGTALHAILELNRDGKNRQGIIVTNNEVDEKTKKKLLKNNIFEGTPEFEAEGICQKITYPRIAKLIQGYATVKGESIEGFENNNLRYYRSKFVPSTKVEINKRILIHSSTELIKIKENCYNEITEAKGFHSRECAIITNNSGKFLIVVYHSRKQQTVNEQLIDFIKNLDTDEKIKLYAYSSEKETIVADFAEVAEKIEAVPLPDSIFNAYKTTFGTLQLDRYLIVPAAIQETDEVGNALELFTPLSPE